RQYKVVDRVMRNHVSRRDFINLKLEGARADVFQHLTHTLLIIKHRFRVAQSAASVLVLGFAETTIIVPVENLDLFAAATVRAQDVEVQVACDGVEGRFVLLAVADRASEAQVKGDRPGYREAALYSRINCGVNRGRPAAT